MNNPDKRAKELHNQIQDDARTEFSGKQSKKRRK